MSSIPRKNIFITGNPSVGKTTLIKEIISIKPSYFGGFYTEQELSTDKNNNIQRNGFIIKTTDGNSVIFASKDKTRIHNPHPLKLNKYYVDTDTLEKIAIPAVDSAINQNKIAVIDEVGSMEILSELFRRKIIEWLSSEAKIIATIRFKAKPFTDELKNRPDTEVITLTTQNKNFVKNLIIHRLNLQLP